MPDDPATAVQSVSVEPHPADPNVVIVKVPDHMTVHLHHGRHAKTVVPAAVPPVASAAGSA